MIESGSDPPAEGGGSASMSSRPRGKAGRVGGLSGRRRHSCVLEARRKVLQQKCLEYRIQGLSVRAIAEQLVRDKVVARIQKSPVQKR
jgi:hypothetical protein